MVWFNTSWLALSAVFQFIYDQIQKLQRKQGYTVINENENESEVR